MEFGYENIKWLYVQTLCHWSLKILHSKLWKQYAIKYMYVYARFSLALYVYVKVFWDPQGPKAKIRAPLLDTVDGVIMKI